MKGIILILFCQNSLAHNMKMMDFEIVYGVPGNYPGCLQHLFFGFGGKTQDNMGTDMNTTTGGHFYRLHPVLKIMLPVNPGQGFLVRRFQAIFDGDIVVPGQALQVGNFFFIDTVGSGANGQTYHPGMG